MPKPKEPEPTGANAWLDEIAAKSKRTPEEIAATFKKYGIEQRSTIAIPKRLTIRSLAFAGGKKGKTTGDIDFHWNDLAPGLYGILSERNLRGKSTLLAMIRWCLTGQRSAQFPPEMKNWFRTVSLKFTLDQRAYEVAVQDGALAKGQLLRLDGDRTIPVGSFESEAAFSEVMSTFFMGELGLEKIVNFAARDGKGFEQPHDWPWLSTAMVFEPDPKVTFGSVAVGGMPVRMMQMFLGIPWANTTNAIMAAKARVANESKQTETAIARTNSLRDARVTALQKELTGAKAELEGLPAELDLRVALRRANREFAEAESRHRALLQLRAGIQADVDAAKEAYDRARRDLQEFKETREAGFVFRSLRPECCPSCDEVFTAARTEENRKQHVCVVCGTPETQGEDPKLQEAALRDAVDAAKTFYEGQKARAEQTKGDLDAEQGRMSAAEAECRSTEQRLAAPSKRRDLELTCLRLEAQIQELQRMTEAAPDGADHEAKILDAAETVTKGALKPTQDAVLKKVSDLTCEYAVRFGIENLEQVAINGATHMTLTKGGQQVAFGAQTQGERARLKIAATMAMLRVAELEGVGRHPGLLLIDSPGANEMVGPDYEKLVDGLADLIKELPHLQVFVAAIDRPVIRKRVPCKNVLYAKGDDYLW